MLRRLLAPVLLLVMLLAVFPFRVAAQQWKVKVKRIGTVTTETSSTLPAGSGSYLYNPPLTNPPTPNYFPLNDTTDISTNYNALVTRQASDTLTLSGSFTLSNDTGTAKLTLGSSSKFRFRIEWSPGINNEPAPFVSNLLISYTLNRKVTGSVAADTVSGGGRNAISDASFKVGEAEDSNVAYAPPYDSEPLDDVKYEGNQRVSVQNAGTTTAFAELDIPISGRAVITLTGAPPPATQPVNGTFSVNLEASVKIENNLPGRYDLPAITGSNVPQATDPTFTRWLPLTFSPSFINQPFGEEGDYLAAPWGNIRCAYSPTIIQNRAADDPLANFDLNSGTMVYRRNDDGSYEIVGNSDTFKAMYVLTDADGSRLLFNQNLEGHADVYSGLSWQTDTDNELVLVLSNAGPPGAMKSPGNFKYKFRRVSLMSPLRCTLKSIEDNWGNKQLLAWNGGLTVYDVSSGRQLIFAPGTGTGGYFQTVTAPGGNVTHLTFNAGHLIQLQVKDGSTVKNQESYTYGASPLQDYIIATTRNGVTSNFAYQSDPVFAGDPRYSGFVTARLQSEGINGTTLATLHSGYLAEGYEKWGKASRTQTITNALYPNDPVTLEYLLKEGFSGSIVAMNVTAPAYHGALAGSNQSSVQFTPDMRRPTSTEVRTPLHAADPTMLPWKATFNILGSPLTFTNPLNKTWEVQYAGDAVHPISVKDPTDIIWKFEWNEDPSINLPADRLRKIIDPNNTVQAIFGYTKNGVAQYGQLQTVTVPATTHASGQAAVVTYDYHTTTGDLMKVTDPLGDQMTVDAYDAFGDPLSVTVYPTTGLAPPAGQPPVAGQFLRATRVLDAAQRVTDKYAPNGVRTENVWGAALPVTEESGRLNQIKTYAPTFAGSTLLAQMTVDHDARGRLDTATDLVGLCADYDYDVLSRLTGIKDGKNNLTSFTYGKNGEPIGVSWAGGGTGSLEYDIAGRVKKANDPRGYAEFTYNDANYLTQMFVSATTQSPAETVNLTYDDAGRVLSVTDSSGSRVFVYEPVRKRLFQVITTLAGLPAGSNSFVLEYQYFPDGTVQSMKSSIVGTWTYAYDKAGQLTSLVSPHGLVTTTYGYDHIGRLTSQNSGSGIVTSTFSYGNTGLGSDTSVAPLHLNGFLHTVNSVPFYEGTLRRSYLGQITQQAISYKDEKFLLARYGYDGRGRLTGEDYAIFPDEGYYLNAEYSHDLANNVRPVSQPWSFNGANQLTGNGTTSNALGGDGLAGATGLSYDASGNLSTMGGQTHKWDGWGRLTGIGANITYGYDSAGRRIKKTVNGVSTYYLYAGGTLIAEVNGSGQLLRSYTWGANGLVSDYSPADGTRFYLFDGTGNTLAMVNGTGGLMGVSGYGAWGETLFSSLPSTPFGWKGQAGQFTDSETGNLYCHRRYYTPKLGRWLSRDPIGFAGGINVYGYCGGDPVNYADPAGLNAQPHSSYVPMSPYQPTATPPPSWTQYTGVGKLTVGRAGIIGAGISAGWGLHTYYHTGQPGDYITGIGYSIGNAIGDWWNSGETSANAQPITISNNPQALPQIEKKDNKPDSNNEPVDTWYHYSPVGTFTFLRHGTSVTTWNAQDGYAPAEINRHLRNLTRDTEHLRYVWQYEVIVKQNQLSNHNFSRIGPPYMDAQLNGAVPVGPPMRIPGR